jgi:hypothetical protein
MAKAATDVEIDWMACELHGSGAGSIERQSY